MSDMTFCHRVDFQSLRAKAELPFVLVSEREGFYLPDGKNKNRKFQTGSVYLCVPSIFRVYTGPVFGDDPHRIFRDDPDEERSGIGFSY